MNVAIATEPPGATVEVRHGQQVLVSQPAPSPVVIDGYRDVTVPQAAGRVAAWGATITGGLFSLGGFSMLLADDKLVQAGGFVVLIPALIVTSIGVLGLVETRDLPFTVSAARPGFRFEDQEFEPTDERIQILMKGKPTKYPVADEAASEQ